MSPACSTSCNRCFPRRQGRARSRTTPCPGPSHRTLPTLRSCCCRIQVRFPRFLLCRRSRFRQTRPQGHRLFLRSRFPPFRRLHPYRQRHPGLTCPPVRCRRFPLAPQLRLPLRPFRPIRQHLLCHPPRRRRQAAVLLRSLQPCCRQSLHLRGLRSWSCRSSIQTTRTGRPSAQRRGARKA